jgi:hypothetical protein
MLQQPGRAFPDTGGCGNDWDKISKVEKRRGSMTGCGLSGLIVALMLLVPGPAGSDDAPGPVRSADNVAPLKRAQHIEFDERLIVGQSLKSGAIYLFERKDSEIQSMVKIRNDFRDELLAPLEPAP